MKIIAITVAAVLILAAGAAFLFTSMAAPENQTGETVSKSAQPPENESDSGGKDLAGAISKSIKSGETTGVGDEAGSENQSEPDKSRIKKTETERKMGAADMALENLKKDRKETLKFLEGYDRETLRKKERAAAIDRWLEK